METGTEKNILRLIRSITYYDCFAVDLFDICKAENVLHNELVSYCYTFTKSFL